ncbi:MAG: site-2 protease family protein [Actinobacteria bacterium]|nr:site-2 protease family protein [Actinomycetota bacterium]
MTGTIGQVSFFVALLVVILVHEAAHFWVAKHYDFKVEEFFVGFGPRLWSFRRGETEYGVKAIPAGGYVKIAGMNPFQEVAPEDLRPATHFVLAFLFFATWLLAVGGPTNRDPQIGRVLPELAGQMSPATTIGLRPGDRIVGIGGIEHPTDLQVLDVTNRNVGEPMALEIERGDRVLSFTVTPILASNGVEKVGRIGITLFWARQREGPIGAVKGSFRWIGETAWNTVRSLGHVFGPEGMGRLFRLVFTDAERQRTDPVSVIGTARIAGQIAEGGELGDILFMFGLVNVFIGILNLLPLLPFDGGHLAVLLVERIRGKRIDARKLVPITAVVATFLIVFTLSVVYVDLTKPPNLLP